MQLHKLTEPNQANIQLMQHEDGYVTGSFRYEKPQKGPWCCRHLPHPGKLLKAQGIETGREESQGNTHFKPKPALSSTGPRYAEGESDNGKQQSEKNK